MSESLLGGNPAPAPAPTPSPEPTPTPAPAPSISFPENWKEALPEEIRQDPSLGAIKDIQNLAKSYVNAQKMVGKDKIIVPDQHATAEDWKGVFRKLGLPENVEKYNVKAEGFQPEFINEFKAAAFNMNLMPNQAENLLGFYKDFSGKQLEAQAAAHKAEVEQQVAGLKQEWGTAFEKNLLIAKGALEQFADAETRKYIEESGLGNDVRLIKLLQSVGAKMGDDQFVGEAKKQMGMTPADAQKRVNDVLGDKAHPYWNKSHPNHGNAVKEVFGLHEYIAEMEKVKK
jgi:hypothetical protein